LTYAPAFAAPEASRALFEGLRPGADENARRLLYVALTRARNRLIVEWPQDDGADEAPLPITARRLMSDLCGVAIEGEGLLVGKDRFPARQIVCGKDIPASFEADSSDGTVVSDRDLRFAWCRRRRWKALRC
jgi:ATP-dependent exoDNAse (exonuclease V) beta subunit